MSQSRPVHLSQVIKDYEIYKSTEDYCDSISISDEYALCLVSDNTKLEKNKLYLKNKNGFIAYTVITPTGETVYDISTPIQSPNNFTTDTLKPLKKAILDTTSKAGHTLAAGRCEIKGKRKQQEDTILFTTDNIITFTQLTPRRKIKCLQATFQQIEHDIENMLDHSEQQGATACHSIAWIDKKNSQLHIWTTNLGDSTAFLVCLDNKKNTSITPLNSRHNPNNAINPKEYERTKHHVKNNRLDDCLAISRAFGDISMECHGLIHEPEIYHHVETIPESSHAYLIIACDGLTEENLLNQKNSKKCICEQGPLKAEDIAKNILTLHKQNTPTNLMAECLVAKALQRESHDNISVIITPVSTTPVSAAVIDGHGGTKVMKIIESLFHQKLTNNIKALATEQMTRRQHFTLLKTVQSCIAQKQWEQLTFTLLQIPETHCLKEKIIPLVTPFRKELLGTMIHSQSPWLPAAQPRDDNLTLSILNNRHALTLDEKKDEKTLQTIVNSILNEKNLLGIALNTPKNRFGFFFTRQKHADKQITGHIYQLKTTFQRLLDYDFDTKAEEKKSSPSASSTASESPISPSPHSATPSPKSPSPSPSAT